MCQCQLSCMSYYSCKMYTNVLRPKHINIPMVIKKIINVSLQSLKKWGIFLKRDSVSVSFNTHCFFKEEYQFGANIFPHFLTLPTSPLSKDSTGLGLRPLGKQHLLPSSWSHTFIYYIYFCLLISVYGNWNSLSCLILYKSIFYKFM